MRPLKYRCKDNDVEIIFHFEDGEIDELWIGWKDTGYTVVGWKDLEAAIIKAQKNVMHK